MFQDIAPQYAIDTQRCRQGQHNGFNMRETLRPALYPGEAHTRGHHAAVHRGEALLTDRGPEGSTTFEGDVWGDQCPGCPRIGAQPITIRRMEETRDAQHATVPALARHAIATASQRTTVR